MELHSLGLSLRMYPELHSLRKYLDRKGFEFKHACKQLRTERKARKQANQNLKDALQAQGILQSIAQGVQDSVHGKIAAVVSKCLTAVFDDAYEFKIAFVRKRGKTEAKISFVRDGLELDPITETSGGVCDMAIFASRISSNPNGCSEKEEVPVIG